MEDNYNFNEDSSDMTEKMTFDEALEQVGASHKYQKIVFLYFGLQWFFAKLKFSY